MWVFCIQAKITPVMLFLLLSVEACHSYVERQSWKQEGRRQGERTGGGKGEREEEGGGEEGRKEIQANIKWGEMCKYKEKNSEEIAITVIIQLHPERGDA